MPMLRAILGLLAVSFVISFLLTRFMVWFSVRIGFVDKPGGRKIHARPKPLGGGVAILLGFCIPMLAALFYVHLQPPPETAGVNGPAYWSGIRQETPLAVGIIVAAVLLHILGVIDDIRALGPYPKLIAQLLIVSMVVIAGKLGVLTVLGFWPSLVLSILWITAITNAFNFLDNMDGLSSGIAVVCTAAFLIATISIGQWFVAAMLALLLGTTAGFLCFNFPPASIFMGDGGSLPLGFLLAVATVRATYLMPGTELANRWWSVLSPVIVLAVPLYDLVVVSAIRLSRGKSPFVGDTNHFSHRLVARGMSRRTAVLCLYLISAATAVAAIILPQVRTTFSALLLMGQTVLILGVVALLEQHPLPPNEKE